MAAKKKGMSPNSREYENSAVSYDDEITELDASMESNPEEHKMMHSVMDADKREVDDGKLISGMINHGVSFMPDLAYENLVKDYGLAEKMYGKTLLRRLTGYDPSFLKKNLRLPEFRRELKARLDDNYDRLKKKSLIDKDGHETEEGIRLSSLVLYIEELDALTAKGFGEKQYKKDMHYGEKADIRPFRTGDPYRSISVKSTIRTAVRRMHQTLEVTDLRFFDKKNKGRINIVYAIDTSGSMKGDKLEMAKKAGIALMYMAITNKDKIGLITFGPKVAESIAPSDDFMFLLEKITQARAMKETSITKAINESLKLFPQGNATKHLILLTDALPTIGEEPEKETIEAATIVNNNGITISLVGINLDRRGLDLAKKITEIGQGRLYAVRDVDEIDSVVLQDYYES